MAAATAATEQSAESHFLGSLLSSLQAADPSFLGLQTRDLQQAVQAAPFTEQPFLEQFLRMNAAALFRDKGPEKSDEVRRNSIAVEGPARVPATTEDV